ncbi:MAG: replication initiation protein, partial [Alphaproteobacteria bacterium]|nr:replication initiation protein [Alphaproteobacteria bacterium]
MRDIEQPISRNNMDGQLSMFDDYSETKNVKIIENGNPSLTEEEETLQNALSLLKDQKNFNPTQFLGTFSQNTELALNQILAMQSNDNPLKKGGKGIGFRCDVLLLATRQSFDTNENTLFDLITGAVSSAPEDEAYTIHSKDFIQYYPSGNIYYLNQVLNAATESLKKKSIDVEFTLPNGKRKVLALPWYNMLMFTKKSEIDDSEDSAYVSFVPTPIFKLLLISSTVIHGSHYNIGVSCLFKSYTRTLFYFLESRKNYNSFDGSTRGKFEMTVEELKYLFRLPENYRPRDINDKILRPAKKKFDEAIEAGIDFTFDYEVLKGNYNKTIGFVFQVTKIVQDSRLEEKKEQSVKIEDKDLATFQIIQGFGFNEVDAKEILDIYKEEKKDIPYLTAALTKMITNNPENRKSYVSKILKNKI